MKVDVRVMQAFVDLMVGKEKFSYPARQGGDRPADEFAHITFLEEYQESIPTQEIKSQTDTETTFQTNSLARIRFRIGIVETDGEASVRIMHGWTSEAMKAEMIKSGYGFIRCTPIGLEDAKLEKEWEPRQGFAVELYVTRTFEETVSNISTIGISGEFITEGAESYLVNIIINE